MSLRRRLRRTPLHHLLPLRESYRADEPGIRWTQSGVHTLRIVAGGAERSDLTDSLLAQGYVCLDQALPEQLGSSLRADGERYEFLPPGGNGGGHFAMGSMEDSAPKGFAEWLRTVCDLRDFVPNEVTYQRYLREAGGLRVHRDQRYYVHCIAIATLRGTATFAGHDPEPPRQLGRSGRQSRSTSSCCRAGLRRLPTRGPSTASTLR